MRKMSENMEKYLKNEELIFALDIGTRSVVGIVGQQENNTFKIIDLEIKHHPDRNMYDGQIHDIEGVVQIVKEVKKSLEDRLGCPLTEVAIAAAGRALKTYRVQVDRLIDSDKEIDRGLINNLEMEGLQLAQAMLDKEEKRSSKYYCVGYTIVNYYLNETIIGSLLGHKGQKIAVDIIATFLPHVVVDSLYTVMNRVGLEVMSLSLEPIAAINVSIPPKARLLNLALVDIGAGTSDIALTKDGTITAYAMASVAGDEITEDLAKKYLLDFDTAESLKLNLKNSDWQTFTDIVGMEYQVSTEEILDTIAPTIDNLAAQIAENILNYNQKSPSAVFLVGGGSQIPRLTEYLAQKLSLPKERIVVRGTEIIQNVSFLDDRLKGPESITPVGIAVTAVKNSKENFIHVTVDGQKVKMFNAKQLTTADALLLVGYNPRKLLAPKGKPLNFFLNGQAKTIFGPYGEMGKIKINGKAASLETKLNNYDEIVIEPATEGEQAVVILKDVLPEEKTVFWQEKPIKLLRELKLNNQEVVDQAANIQDGDSLTYKEIKNLQELLEFLQQEILGFEFYANGSLITLDYLLKDNDYLTCQEQVYPITEKAKKNHLSQTITVTVNEEPVTFQHNKEKLLFLDIFNYINFDLNAVQGQVDIELNGDKASFTDLLKPGDNIRIICS